MKIIVQILKWAVGGLFIFSGLIKLNDPVGMAIKLEEYFEVFASDFASFFHVFVPFALQIGLVLCVLEVILGISLLINYRAKATIWALLGLIIFFTFLTFYSAYFNKVTDCGCFGDAIKLTPWESFTKDVILLLAILVLFVKRKSLETEIQIWKDYATVAITFLLFFIAYYAIEHLPFIDFRAYKVGDNIRQNMIPAKQPIIEYIFNKDGKRVVSEKFLSQEEGYQFESTKIKNPKASKPKITDFSVWNDEGDYTERVLTGAVLIIVIQDVSKANKPSFDKIRSLISALDTRIQPVVLTSSDQASYEAFSAQHSLDLPYYFADATVLKTIIRSNPGVAFWIDANVKGNWHFNDVPTASEVNALL